MQATISDLFPNLPEILKNNGERESKNRLREESEALRHERKVRKWIDKRKKNYPACQSINLTEGCRIGKREAKFMKSTLLNLPEPEKSFGRISRQEDAPKSDVQAGFRAVNSEFEKTYHPSFPAEEKSPATIPIPEQQRVQAKRAWTKGFAVRVPLKKKR